jgi:hypothetical protein
MSWLTTVENQLAAHANAAKGIETIANLARAALAAEGDSGAANALSITLSIAEAVINGLTGAAHPADVKATIDKFLADIATADAAADAEAARRFDTTDTKPGA